MEITKENDSLQRQTENKDEDSQKIQGNKNIPELRFPEFEGEWNKNTLNNLAKIQRGASPRPISSNRWYDNENKKVGWVRIGDVTNSSRYLYRTEDYFSEEGIKKSRFLPKGSLIMSICATIGKPIITEIDTCIHDGFVGFSDLTNINKEFLYYILKNLENKFISLSQTGSQANLNTNLINKTKINMPSIKEQEKIANFLTCIDQKIELMEKTNKNYQRVLKYYIHKLLEIGDKEHNQLIQIKDCIIESKEKNLNGLNLPIISSTLDGIFLQSDYFDNDSVAIDVTKYKIIPKNYFTYRSMSDTGIFKFNIQNLYERALVSSAYPVFKVKSEINSDYFKYYLNYSNMMKKQLYINKEGGTRYALSISKFKKMNIILPSSKVQTKISNVINSLNKKYEINNKKLHYLKQFKKGLLQKMFC